MVDNTPRLARIPSSGMAMGWSGEGHGGRDREDHPESGACGSRADRSAGAGGLLLQSHRLHSHGDPEPAWHSRRGRQADDRPQDARTRLAALHPPGPGGGARLLENGCRSTCWAWRVSPGTFRPSWRWRRSIPWSYWGPFTRAKRSSGHWPGEFDRPSSEKPAHGGPPGWSGLSSPGRGAPAQINNNRRFNS